MFIVKYRLVIQGEFMEFFRKHQRAIIAIIAVTFIAWTVGLMMIPLVFK